MRKGEKTVHHPQFFFLCLRYVQSMAEAQQFTTNVASKCGGNPTWTTAPSSFQITSNRKFLYCLVWDQPSAALASPSCVGEISIPIGELATV